jgi:hypothetical protein
MRAIAVVFGVLLTVVFAVTVPAQTGQDENAWSVKATVFDACSCNLLCPCLFNTHPDKDFCKYNTVVKIEKGHYGETTLDGMKMWMSGDMGADFSNGEFKSMYITFEPTATQEQIDGAKKVLSLVGMTPAKVRDAGMDRATIAMERKRKTAHAKLGDGQGELSLSVLTGKDGENPVVLTNVVLGTEKINHGFILAKSTHHYKGHQLDYAYKDASGGIYEIESSGGGK